MDWVKEISPSGGAHGGMRGDFPLSHDLPSKIGVDCTRLLQPIHPMFGVRLRVFVDWHLHKGREVTVLPPSDAATKRLFRAMRIDALADVDETVADAVLPVTRLGRHNEAEEVAWRTQEILEYQLTDVSPLGQAAFMAVAELCDNDSAAIAHATESSITGTGDPHRGIGFSAVMEAALTASLHAARMDIYSANGFFRLQVVQESRKPEIFPASNYRRGTWITYDLVSV